MATKRRKGQKRSKRAKTIITTPFSRITTSFESKAAAREDAKIFRAKKRANPSLWRGSHVVVVDE